MLKAEFEENLETRINVAAKAIAEKKSTKLDEMALGKLTVLLTLRRVLGGKGTPEDLGFLDALNDSLQALGLIESGVTFLAKLE